MLSEEPGCCVKAKPSPRMRIHAGAAQSDPLRQQSGLSEGTSGSPVELSGYPAQGDEQKQKRYTQKDDGAAWLEAEGIGDSEAQSCDEEPDGA